MRSTENESPCSKGFVSSVCSPPVPADGSAWPAQRFAPQAAEDVGQGPHPQLAGGARGERQLAVVALQVAGLLERAGQRAQLLEIPGRLVAAQVLERLGVDLLQGVGVARRQQLLLHGVEALLPVDRGQRLGQAERLVAAERIRLAEWPIGPQRLQGARQARHVPAQPIVAQQLVHHLLQLGAHLRAQRCHQRRHLRRLPVQVVDQLVDVLDPRREEVPVARHEAGEVGTRIGSGRVLLEQLVEVAHHGAHPVEVLRRDAGDPSLSPWK